MTGVFFRRKIEHATFDSIAFRHLAANQHPHHDTIASCRQRFLPQLKGIFIADSRAKCTNGDKLNNSWSESRKVDILKVETVVENLDLSAIKNTYKEGGAKGYSPEILISLIFYGYITGVFSRRKIEHATFDSIAFRYLAANQHPDHDTITSFRQRFLPQLKGIFIQILMIA